MSNDSLVAGLADKARLAARSLRASDYATRKNALLAIADEIESARAEIIAANKEDVDRERAGGLNESLIDRLLLNDSRISGIIGGTKKVAALEIGRAHV